MPPVSWAAMYVVIMAGGGGTRLWPLSRPERPKPFLPLVSDETLIQRTVRRILPLVDEADIFVVADRRYGQLVRDQVPDVGLIAPVFWRGQLVAFTPMYSHHTDMGGRFPGSFTSAGMTSFEEGVRIPLLKLYEEGKRNDLLRQANNLIYDEAPIWFFNYNKAVLAYQPWIHGLQANPSEITHQ